MYKEDCIDRYKKGVEAWNIWANDMLAKKAVLKKNKQWQIEKSKEGKSKEGVNQATKDWLAESKVDFSKYTFEEKVSFKNFIFPNDVLFVDTEFMDYVFFESAVFRGEVYFNRAKFHSDAWLNNTEFSNDTLFDRVEFNGCARFHDAIFREEALLDQIVFKGFADFSNTVFEKKASFISIQGRGFLSFKGTKFYLVPDFSQAHFIEAPQFDDSDFSKAIKHSQSNGKDNLSSNWRSLKRLAIQGHDHERELLFFSEEIKSQRGIQDTALPCPLNYYKNKPVWPGGARFWLGWFYECSSDFGRSVMLPILLMIILGFFSYLFYREYPIEDKPTYDDPITQETNSCNRSEAAIFLSARSALPFLPATNYSENINRSYECLYGKNSEGKANIPYWVVIISIVQAILSTMLIFLSLLALRNHFKIK